MYHFNKIILASISLCFMMTSCSDNLKSKFEDCYVQKKSVSELLHDSDIKERIIQSYSQGYYDKMIQTGVISSPVYYDSITNCFHVYAWKNHKFDIENQVKLRYYANKDSVVTNMFINNIEIDKTGYSDYAGCFKNAKQYIQPVTKLANQGNATAQVILGVYHLFGNGIEKNEEKAFQWLSEAAKQNLGNAQYLLGILYTGGTGTNKNMKKGIEWLQKAAEQEHIPAINLLANAYIEGKEIPQNYPKALELYLQAARLSPECQYILGNIYWESKIVKTDKKKAIQWFTTAAENNDQNSQITLGTLYLEGDEVDKDLSKSLYWFTKAADQGNADMQYLLARIYMQDEIALVLEDYPTTETIKEMASKNLAEGVKWLKKAAEQGHLGAQRGLGAYYYNVEENMEEARKWFHKVAEQGDDSWIAYPGMY